MPNINFMLFKLEFVQYDVSLNFNMGYYHIHPSKNASNLCTFILPWVEYFYKRLTMVVADSPEIFQHKMNDSFHGFRYICEYID